MTGTARTTAEVALLDDPDRLRAALTPLRRTLLDALGEPASATGLATLLGLPRQKVNYHLRVLEEAGLVELVEVRQRRGCSERVMRRTAREFVVDPDLIPRPSSAVRRRDRHAADHLVGTASAVVRDVTRMQAAAQAQGRRLLTFTLETEVALAQPADVHAYSDALAEAVAEVTRRFHSPGGRRHRVVVGGHPAPRRTPPTTPQEQPGAVRPTPPPPTPPRPGPSASTTRRAVPSSR